MRVLANMVIISSQEIEPPSDGCVADFISPGRRSAFYFPNAPTFPLPGKSKGDKKRAARDRRKYGVY